MGSLPGGGKYAICTQYTYLRDNTEIINVGIKPGIYVEPTIDDYKNGFDRIFHKGIHVLREICTKE